MAFQTVKGNDGVLKPDSLVQPVIGTYREKKTGIYSPVYVIETNEGKIVKIRGCRDLDNKMADVQIDNRVFIQFSHHTQTSQANPMAIMIVKVDDGEGDEANEEPRFQEGQMHSQIKYDPNPVGIPQLITLEPPSKPGPLNALARFGINQNSKIE